MPDLTPPTPEHIRAQIARAEARLQAAEAQWRAADRELRWLQRGLAITTPPSPGDQAS